MSFFHSLGVSHKLEPSTDPHPPPFLPNLPPGRLSVDGSSVFSPLQHANPSSHAHLSSCNPFSSVLQQNPFYEDILALKASTPPLPPLPYLSSSCPPLTQVVPQPSSSNPLSAHAFPTMEDPFADAQREGMTAAAEGPPPPDPSEAPPPRKSSNPFRRVDLPQDDGESQWDESFEAFAAGRLQPPVVARETSWFSREEHTAFRRDGDRALNPANLYAVPACSETKHNSSTNTSAAPSHSTGTAVSGISSGPGLLADEGLFWFSSKEPKTVDLLFQSPSELGSATQTDPDEPQLNQENRVRSTEVQDGSVVDSSCTVVKISGSNDDSSFLPPSYIFTSSPRAQPGLLDRRQGPNFLRVSSTPDSQESFTDAKTLDRSGTSVFPSLYLSTESQDYQTCRSPISFNPSDQTPSKASLPGDGDKTSEDLFFEIPQTSRFKPESLQTSIPERSKSQDSFMSYDLKAPPEGGGEVQDADSTGMSSKHLKLQRSRSEGALAPPTPSLENDPCSRRRSSWAPLGGHLLSLTPPAPQSFPVALPPRANLSVVRPRGASSPEGPEPQAVVQQDR